MAGNTVIDKFSSDIDVLIDADAEFLAVVVIWVIKVIE
jgi:PHP family Zn ribbon phosphoesterase